MLDYVHADRIRDRSASRLFASREIANTNRDGWRSAGVLVSHQVPRIWFKPAKLLNLNDLCVWAIVGSSAPTGIGRGTGRKKDRRRA